MSAQAAVSTSRAIAVRLPKSKIRETWSERARRATATFTPQNQALAGERTPEQEALILKLMGLVKRIAHELRQQLPAHIEADDLVSAGTLGLIDAVRRFEADKEVKIETYARFRIRGAMLDALRGMDPVSRDMRKKNKQAEEVFQALAKKLGRAPSDAEMADALCVSLNEWYGTVNKLQGSNVDWLRPMQVNEDYLPDEDSLPDDDPADQFALCYRREQHDLIDRALEKVSDRDRRILSLYYEQELTMKQIADELGVDESRVSQIHASLLGRLRKNVQSMLRNTAAQPAMAQAA